MKVTSPKAIALDLDGTLLCSNHKISSRATAILRKLHGDGIHIILASGRPIPLQKCLAPQLPESFHIVASNGSITAEYRDLSVEVKNCVSIPPTSVVTIAAALNPHNIPFIVINGDHGHAPTEVWTNTFKEKYMEYVSHTPDFSSLHSSKMIAGISVPLFFSSPSTIEEMRSKVLAALTGLDLAGLGIKVVHGKDWVDLNPLNGGKSAGLALLCERLGMRLADILAFGDGDNDLCMLSKCGMSVAPSNASANAKAAAKQVSSWNNDEDFVYKELGKIFGIHLNEEGQSVGA